MSIRESIVKPDADFHIDDDYPDDDDDDISDGLEEMLAARRKSASGEMSIQDLIQTSSKNLTVPERPEEKIILKPPPPVQKSAKSESLDDIIYSGEEDEEDEDEGEEEPWEIRAKKKQRNKKSVDQPQMPKIMEILMERKLAVIALLVATVFICVAGVAKLIDEKAIGQPKDNVQAASSPKVVEKIVESVQTATVWGTKAEVGYEEYVELPKKYYTDEVVVTKFTIADGGAVTYYLSGIPKNFKNKIVFPISPQEYNLIPSGGKIFIDYKVVKVKGKDYVTDITTSVRG